MRTTRSLSLIMASTAVLALAACNRSAQPSESAEVPAEAGPAAMPNSPEAAPPVTPLPAQEAAAPVAPPPPPALKTAAPDIGYAEDYDSHIARGSGYDAWTYQEDGRAYRAWQDPRYGWRIVEPGPQGQVIYYYRTGATEPYLVRQGGLFLVFSGGRLQRAYGSNGRAVTITAELRDRRARQLMDRARRARQQAERTSHAERKQARRDRLEDRRDDRREQRQDRRDDKGRVRAPDKAAPAHQGKPVNPKPKADKPSAADKADAAQKARCERRAEKGLPRTAGCPKT